jgi:hypothetical protein
LRGFVSSAPPPPPGWCEDDGGLRVGDDGLEPFEVPGHFRGKQRDGDGAGLDGREGADDIVRALRCEDRDPVARVRDLLKSGGDDPDPGAELGPGQRDATPSVSWV